MSEDALFYCGTCNKFICLEDHRYLNCPGTILCYNRRVHASKKPSTECKITTKKIRFGDDVVRYIPRRNQSETEFRRESRR